jgi:hypothetical protein
MLLDRLALRLPDDSVEVVPELLDSLGAGDHVRAPSLRSPFRSA